MQYFVSLSSLLLLFALAVSAAGPETWFVIRNVAYPNLYLRYNGAGQAVTAAPRVTLLNGGFRAQLWRHSVLKRVIQSGFDYNAFLALSDNKLVASPKASQISMIPVDTSQSIFVLSPTDSYPSALTYFPQCGAIGAQRVNVDFSNLNDTQLWKAISYPDEDMRGMANFIRPATRPDLVLTANLVDVKTGRQIGFNSGSGVVPSKRYNDPCKRLDQLWIDMGGYFVSLTHPDLYISAIQDPNNPAILQLALDTVSTYRMETFSYSPDSLNPQNVNGAKISHRSRPLHWTFYAQDSPIYLQPALLGGSPQNWALERYLPSSTGAMTSLKGSYYIYPIYTNTSDSGISAVWTLNPSDNTLYLDSRKDLHGGAPSITQLWGYDPENQSWYSRSSNGTLKLVVALQSYQNQTYGLVVRQQNYDNLERWKNDPGIFSSGGPISNPYFNVYMRFSSLPFISSITLGNNPAELNGYKWRAVPWGGADSLDNDTICLCGS